MQPLQQNPPPEPLSQPGGGQNIEVQIDHGQQPGNPQASPPPPPNRSARWGTIIGRSLVLLIKVTGYIAFSPFILAGALGFIISSGFSGKEIQQGAKWLFRPLSKEVAKIFLASQGTSKSEMRVEAARQREEQARREAEERARQAAPQPHEQQRQANPAANPPAPQVNPPQAGHAGGPPLNPPPPNPPPNPPDL